MKIELTGTNDWKRSFIKFMADSQQRKTDKDSAYPSSEGTQTLLEWLMVVGIQIGYT